jgi:hypothetical protein
MYPPFQHHCWGFYHDSRAVVDFIKKDITTKLSQCDEWFPCQSAFNGFAIYRTHVFKGIRYDGEYKNLRELIPDNVRKRTLSALKNVNGSIQINEAFVESCEHLYYHLIASMQRNARIYISKHFIV